MGERLGGGHINDRGEFVRAENVQELYVAKVFTRFRDRVNEVEARIVAMREESQDDEDSKKEADRYFNTEMDRIVDQMYALEGNYQTSVDTSKKN